MSLLGISIIRTIDNIELLVDLLPDYKKINKSQFIRNREVFECQIQIIKQLEHWQLWRILQKLLCFLKNCPINDVYIRLFNYDPKTYSKQRNSIIYHNNVWFFKDLKEEIIDDEFGIVEFNKLDLDNLPNELYFTIITSYVLVYIEKVLFKDISQLSKHFGTEFNLMKSALLNNNLNFRKFEDINFYSTGH